MISFRCFFTRIKMAFLFSASHPHAKLKVPVLFMFNFNREFSHYLKAMGIHLWKCALIFSFMTLHVDLVHAQEKDSGLATAITSFNELWNPAQLDADKARLIRLEGQVLYYDPSWAMLWLHDGELGGYIDYASDELDLRAGDHIELFALPFLSIYLQKTIYFQTFFDELKYSHLLE